MYANINVTKEIKYTNYKKVIKEIGKNIHNFQNFAKMT